MSEQSAVAAPPEEETQVRRETRQDKKPKRQPPYHVVLWNDDDHTVEYVIAMMRELFGYTVEQGAKIALEVHTQGRSVVLTTTREHAELKRDQIHAFGKDITMSESKGSMSCSIEPAE